jgi:hypothetical protein
LAAFLFFVKRNELAFRRNKNQQTDKRLSKNGKLEEKNPLQRAAGAIGKF